MSAFAARRCAHRRPLRGVWLALVAVTLASCEGGDGGGSSLDSGELQGARRLAGGDDAATTDGATIGGAPYDAAADTVEPPDAPTATQDADGADDDGVSAADAAAVDAATDDAASGLSIALGTTIPSGMAWAPLPPGAEMPLIFGPQGGYHVWLSVCVPALTTGPLLVDADLRRASDGAAVAPGAIHVTTLANNYVSLPGYRCRLAMPVFVTCACDADGVPMILRARVTLESGAAAEKERAVVPVHSVGPCQPKGAQGCGGG